MKKILNYSLLALTALFLSCGGKEEKKQEGFSFEKPAASEQTVTKAEPAVAASQRIDLINKGVGPIKSVTLSAEIDQALATQGEDIFGNMCTACHRSDKKFIGPAPTGILERRSPEWVMNMILNPDGMVKSDPLARDLLAEFNGAPMANQNLTEAEARAVLEFFRTLK